MSTAAIDDFPYISNEDVNVLYDIVSLAETTPGPPFRALFSAYDEVLKQHGLEPATDQVYFRFLLRMREQPSDGESFVDQFQALLAKLGIRVDFDQAQDNDDEATEDVPVKTIESDHNIPSRTLPRERVSRRASFSSFQENTSTHLLEAELNKRLNRPRSVDFGERSRDRKITDWNHGAMTHSAAAGARRTIAQTQVEHKPQRPNGHPQNKQIQRNLPIRPAQVRARQAAIQALDDAANGSPLNSEQSSTLSQASQDYEQQDAEEQIEDEDQSLDLVQAARTLQFHHVAAQCTKLFRDWSDMTKPAADLRRYREQTAQAQYQRILVQSVVDRWLDLARLRQQEHETEHFFEALETRVGKARNLYILTKAFTHWAACAEEQVVRTSAARRHIIRTKYFNAWRDITAVNEMKIRRLTLGKIFRVWKNKTATMHNDQQMAESVYLGHLQQAAWNKWFWTYCDERAPTWYASKLKIIFLDKWRHRAREVTTRSTWAEQYQQSIQLRRNFLSWTEQASALRKKQQDAVIFRRQHLLRPIFQDMQRETELGPVYEDALIRVDIRAQQRTFAMWLQLARTCIEAKKFDDLRLMKTAWVAWRDSVRCNAIQRTTTARIKAEALYKWALAERLSLKMRLAAEKTTHNILQNWRSRVTDAKTRLQHAQLAALDMSRRHLKTQAFRQWLRKARPEQENIDIASHFRKRHLLETSLAPWVDALRNTQRLQARASHVNFYVVATHTMKQWREATTDVQRHKRRDAYASIRRQVKVNLTRRLLLGWHDKTARLTAANSVAHEKYANQVLSYLPDVFEMWYSRILTAFSSSEQAADFLARSDMTKTLQRFLVRFESLQQLSVEATAFARLTSLNSAASCLRQLNRQAFQLDRQNETADSAVERTRRRHYKGILKWWAGQARQKRLDRQPSQQANATVLRTTATPLTKSLRVTRAVPASTITAARRHVISAFDNSVADTSTSAQTPGYLKTPSRHQRALARTAHQASYTPAGQPVLPTIAQSAESTTAPETPAANLAFARRQRATHMTPFLKRLQERGRSNLSTSVSLGFSDGTQVANSRVFAASARGFVNSQARFGSVPDRGDGGRDIAPDEAIGGAGGDQDDGAVGDEAPEQASPLQRPRSTRQS